MITRTWTATDECGNTTPASCVQTIDGGRLTGAPTIVDASALVNVTVECDECDGDPSNTGAALLTATDNCVRRDGDHHVRATWLSRALACKSAGADDHADLDGDGRVQQLLELHVQTIDGGRFAGAPTITFCPGDVDGRMRRVDSPVEHDGGDC